MTGNRLQTVHGHTALHFLERMPFWMTGPSKPSLKGDYVYHGFMILSLLLDSKKRHSILTVPHDSEQANRFKHAIHQHNACIKLYGQPEILHACKKCVRLYPEQGKCMYI
jgi:hypothetical protein